MNFSVEASTETCCRELLETAVRMNRMSSARFDSEIAPAMEKMMRAFGVEHILLGELSPDGTRIIPLHVGTAPGFSNITPAGTAIRLPYMLGEIRNADPLVLPSLPDGVPPDETEDRRFVENSGIRSALMIPVKPDLVVTHVLSAFRLRKPGPWPDDDIACLKSAAELFSSVHERMSVALEQAELNPIEDLLNEISSVYINLPPQEIVQVVNHDLGRLSRLIGADRYAICLAEDINSESSEVVFSFDYWPNELKEKIEAEYTWFMAHGGHRLFRYITDQCLQGNIVAFSNIDELPETEPDLKSTMHSLGVRSELAVPISVNRKVIGLMIILATRKQRDWPEELIRKVRQFGDLFANAYTRKHSEESRQQSHRVIERLKARLESDYRYLSDEFKKSIGGEIIVGEGPAMNRVMEQVAQVAPTQTPVLLLGETGSGKGMLALALHQASRRGNRPMVQLNCATLAPGLIESELYGHERGAFTGADKQRVGRFEIADGATLFLDEIGELPLALQARLLRVLETGEFERLGGSRTLKTDARIIAATNRDLEAEVAAGRFRRDLWYRLSIFPIRIPPLRKRSEDIPAIVEGLVALFSEYSGKHFDQIPRNVMEKLKAYHWPGNVRELKNLIERAVIVSPGGELGLAVPGGGDGLECSQPVDEVRPFAEMERSYLLHALKQAGWRVEGHGGAAELLELNPSTLRSRMRKRGIRKQRSGLGKLNQGMSA